jgi:hypothetical protein
MENTLTACGNKKTYCEVVSGDNSVSDTVALPDIDSLSGMKRKFDDVAFDDRWLSAAMFCATAAANLADAGEMVLLKDAAPFDPKLHLVFGPTAFDSTFYNTLQFGTIDASDVAEVDKAYKVNAHFFMRGFSAWTGRDDFSTIIDHTITLPSGLMMHHRKGVGGHEVVDGRLTHYTFDEKWNQKQRSIWFSPCFDVKDAAVSTHHAIGLHSSHICLLTTTNKSGVIDLDKFGGFRPFLTIMTRMCADGGISDDGLFSGEADPTALTEKMCTTFANSKGHLGDQDRHIPVLVQAGFAGWVLKYNKSRLLERQVLLCPRGRKDCEYWEMDKGLEEVDITPVLRDALRRACQVHLVDALAAGIDHYNILQTVRHGVDMFGIDALQTVVDVMPKEEREKMLTYVYSAFAKANMEVKVFSNPKFVDLLGI